ncbi:signal peptidase, endoplasmic reticulum-type [Arthrobacter alpinus]|uniref:Signal peptidase, endoplasmic reticulum-type n=1 Tax=Arthrobacter alpinus TaxID=656366 RepID=A0A1H5KGH2_9MICC|nr:S26 family signal peptidase [Arthrobacter alpinus]SEE63527.1 signal peptidase, endoplasmic reticulum-type [Arthrobacter alpinus]
MPEQLVQDENSSGSNSNAAGRVSLERAARVLNIFREGFLTIIAVAGVICIIGITAGYFLNASFVVFKTGSMEPHYPVGAISLTIKIPAKELKPGDVASVLRDGATVLITHRVVSVNDDPAGPQSGKAVLTLKGDANSSEDPVLYTVASAQKVVFTVPRLGAWVMAMRGPWFLGAATLIVSALVAWSFWPKRARKHRAEPEKSIRRLDAES